ncbi:cysteine proteinase, partial [Conidiobolus coronatus NRRL 28638]
MTIQEFNTELGYTKDQLNLYLNRINFFKDGSFEGKELPVNYETLERVTKGHVNSIPYGNLAFAYYKRLQKPEGNYPCDIRDPLTTQGVSTDLQDIFKKLVLEERDGYCFENNLLCVHMLMTLGFTAYATSSRIIAPHIWDQFGTIEIQPITHACIIVELEGKDYLLDVGLRLGGTSKPILMEEGLVQETNPLVEHRFSRVPYPDRIVQSTNPKYFPWLLEAKCKQLPNKPFHRRNDWTPLTYTNPTPIYLKDIELLNNVMVTAPNGILFRSCITMTINTDEGYTNLRDQTLRVYTLKDGVKTIKLDTEEERRAAYKQYFNVKVPEDHIEHLPNV